MADQPNIPAMLLSPPSPTGEYGDDFVRKVQDRIEDGKRNAPEILKLVALNAELARK